MTAVGDLIELAYGKALKDSDRDGGDVPVVGSGGIVGRHSRGITDAPSIVVGRKGSIGRVTWVDGPAWPIDTAYFVKPRRNDLDRRWAYWMLKSRRLETMNKSAAVPGLNRDDVYRLEVNLPPLPEQRRIAAILDHADALRAKHRQVLAHLDALAQSIFHNMFGNEHWATTLSDLADVQIGPFGSLLHQSDYVSGGVAVINPMHIRGGALEPDPQFSVSARKASTLESYRLRPGDVVLGRRGEMARAGIAAAEHAGMLCGTGSIILRPRGVDSRFLHAVVTSPRMKRHLERSSLGATLPNLNAAIVNASPCPRAPERAQMKFSGAIIALERARADAIRACSADDKLFESLQSQAFDGRL